MQLLTRPEQWPHLFMKNVIEGIIIVKKGEEDRERDGRYHVLLRERVKHSSHSVLQCTVLPFLSICHLS